MSETLNEISEIERRLRNAKEHNLPGLDLIIDGLMLLAAHVQENNADGVLVQELLVVVSKFTDGAVELRRSKVANTTNEAVVPEHILSLFREEARKRLAGLSISMMGIFYKETSDGSIDQSAGHLHAVKGTAAMVGFPEIAKLAEIMERVVFSLRPMTESEKSPALKPLMRSYAILESLVETVSEDGSEDAVQQVSQDLLEFLGEKEIEEKTPNEFSLREETGVGLTELTKRILVVDDDQTVAATVSLVLSDLGVEIDVAHDGASALLQLSNRPYSLVISDISMPDIDGLALIDTMRADESFSDIPVILLTGRHSEVGAEKADDLIVKGSIGSGELRARVGSMLLDAPVVLASKPTTERQILIVEDAETVAASIAFVLSEGPYEIMIAYDGRDGLEKLEAGSFDLVISDWQMPRMDGIELLTEIRNHPTLRSVPFLFLTSTRSDELRKNAAAIGADGFMIKGDVGSAALLQTVEKLIAP